MQTYKHHIFAPTADARCPISPKICMVLVGVENILKDANHFSIQHYDFPTGSPKNSKPTRGFVHFCNLNSVTCEANYVKHKILMQGS